MFDYCDNCKASFLVQSHYPLAFSVEFMSISQKEKFKKDRKLIEKLAEGCTCKQKGSYTADDAEDMLGFKKTI